MNPFYICDKTSKANSTFSYFQKNYPPAQTIEQCDVIVVLGGDGFMLQTLHEYQHYLKPFYGINCGTVGFLLNTFHKKNDFINTLKQSQITQLSPLRMTCITSQGNEITTHAINEVGLFRQTGQTSHIKIDIDGVCRMENLVGDGLIVSTPAGSTGYNLSAHGPILPIGSGLIALTPLNPYRPRRWRGAILPDSIKIQLTILDFDKRTTMVTADSQEVHDVVHVTVQKETNLTYTILFDAHHNLEERILGEQFWMD
jgi:NAD+ kinase